MKIDLELNERQINDLIKKLRNIEPKISKKILRQESRNAAKTHLLATAKTRTPKRSGLLKRSIKILAIKRTRTAVGVRVAMSSKSWSKKFYGGFVEYGTPARKIKGVEMMRNTVKDKGEQAANAFVNAVARRIDEVI